MYDVLRNTVRADMFPKKGICNLTILDVRIVKLSFNGDKSFSFANTSTRHTDAISNDQHSSLRDEQSIRSFTAMTCVLCKEIACDP